MFRISRYAPHSNRKLPTVVLEFPIGQFTFSSIIQAMSQATGCTGSTKSYNWQLCQSDVGLTLSDNVEATLKYGKTGNKKRATCLATLLQNELNNDVARFTTHIKPVLQQIRFLIGLNISGKTRNIAIQLV